MGHLIEVLICHTGKVLDPSRVSFTSDPWFLYYYAEASGGCPEKTKSAYAYIAMTSGNCTQLKVGAPSFLYGVIQKVVIKIGLSLLLLRGECDNWSVDG